MYRRAFLRTVFVGAVVLFTMGHTPYKQWQTYRKQHLLILTNRADASYPLGKQVAEILATHLPESKARVARAPHLQRVASLISTKQLDVALLKPADAVALMHGKAPFDNFDPVPLRTIIGLGDYFLVCRDDFPDAHAYLVAKTLSTHREQFTEPVWPARNDGYPDAEPRVPFHPGALDYYQGEPLPGDNQEDEKKRTP